MRVPGFGAKQALDLTAREALLTEVDGRIRTTMTELESHFLKISDKLEGLDSSSRSLIGQCEKLIHLAAGSTEGDALLRDSLNILKEPLDYIDFCMERQSKLLDLLSQCEEQTRGMLGIRSLMHDAIAPLTHMAVLFKIESAYLPDEHRDSFLAVTSEVGHLHQLVDETFLKNSRQLEMAHSTLSGVRVRLEADFRRHAALVASKRARIDTAIKALNTQLDQNGERDMRLHEHGGRLASEVSKIVMGIQFQDIVKQKCDHVMEALRVPVSDEKEWAHTLALQIRQLTSVCVDITDGFGSMDAGLGRIEQYTTELSHSSISLENIESMTAAMDGMVQLLLDTFSDVSEIIGMVEELTRQGYDSVLPANGIASNLTTTIVELSHNMRLIALNAQVRSIQSGQGTGLEILAARTAEISGEIDGISGRISSDLERLHSAINEMLAMFEEFRSRGAAQLSALSISRGPAESRLHALRDATITAIQEISDKIDGMLLATKAVHESLSVIPCIKDNLASIQGELRNGMPKVQLSPEDSAAALSGMLAKYTMASEREVHETYFAEAAQRGEGTLVGTDPVLASMAPPPATPAVGSQGDDVTLFDNFDASTTETMPSNQENTDVTLFDDSSPTPSSGSGNSVINEGAGEEVPVTDGQIGTSEVDHKVEEKRGKKTDPAAPLPSTTQPPDLGSNVELF